MSIAHKVNGSWQKTAGLPPVDSALSSTSQNPLENRQIYAALADKITASVSNLVNYYKKSETYTQAEVRQLIGAISTLSIKVVAALPTTDISATTIYWVGPDATTGKYDQYIYADNAWVKTGDTSVNLGDYVTTEALELAIADFLTETEIRAILASYYTKTEVDTLLNGKQNSLTFDNAPTENSTNVVKSGGVYSTVDDVYKVMGENGAKNLLPYPFYGNSTKTLNGITFTDNGDGTVTANGTATADADFYPFFANIGTKKLVTLPAGKYTISGCPSGGSSTSYYIYISLWNEAHTGGVTKGFDYGEGFELTLDEETELRGFIVRVVNGQAVSNLTFSPMIRLASDTDSTYQPYAMTNQQLTPYIQAISNPNILDNGWFTVNQRQFTSATDTTTLRPADRWYGSVNDSNITIANTANGISISGVPNNAGENLIRHAFEWNRISDKVGKTFTLSIMFDDGSIKSNSGKLTLPSTDIWQAHIVVNVPEHGMSVQFLTYKASPNWGEVYIKSLNATSNLSVTIRAIKLELGAVSTLANDVAPNYQQELAKCQRYFVRFKSNATYSVYSDMGYVVSATEVRTPMNLPVSMRQSPTVTTSGSLRIFNATDYSTMSQSITSVSGMGFLGSKLMLKCVGTGFISGKMAMLAADNDADTYIDFSADL